MANKTVYPYGQNGTLPSGYPIADDLGTDSAQQALSARQGKVIGDYLFPGEESVDIASIADANYTIADKGSNEGSAWGAGKHKAIPVVAGQKITLSVASTDNGGYYCWFTSYSAPSASTSPTYFLLGWGRAWLAGSKTMIVPAGATYLIVNTKNASNTVFTWSLKREVAAGNNFVTENSDEFTVPSTEAIDLDSVELSNYSLGDVNWTRNAANNWGKHKAIPVTPGKVYRVRVASGRGYIGFLTSAYVAPTSASAIPYTKGTRGFLQASNGWKEYQAPSNAAYLCLCYQDGAGNSGAWEMSEKTTITLGEAFAEQALLKDSVADNLMDGGRDVPLSAEQGKVLRSFITDGIPAGMERHEYTGSSVRLARKHHVAASKVATVGVNMFQGGACYGDYLFMFKSNNTTCWIYNLASSSLIQTITIPEEERGFVATCHCNTVNFGPSKYDADDPFPLIYVSTGYSDGTNTGVLVYRIVATTENDVTTYALTLVQTVKFPGTSWTEFLVGDERDCYICVGDTTYRMRMPTLSQGDITLDFSNALDTYRVTPQPSWYNGSRGQNRIYNGGKIFMVSGVPQDDEKSLFISIDLVTGKREIEIDLIETFGWTAEPETIFIWHGRLCVAFANSANVYALYFE